MKNLLVALICFPIFIHAQTTENKNRYTSIDGQYNWTHTGENLIFNYNLHSKNHFFTTGLVVHINTQISDNRQYAYQHRFYHRTQAERIGLNLGYSHMIKVNFAGVHPYYFFNLQAQHIGLRNQFPVPTIDTVYNFGDIQTQYVYFNPIYSFETTMGAGMIINLVKGFSINQTIGVGNSLMLDNNLGNPGFTSKRYHPVNEFLLMVRFGVNYTFPIKK